MATDNIFSGLWARRVLNHFNGTTTLAAPGTLYVALLYGVGGTAGALPDLDDNVSPNTLAALNNSNGYSSLAALPSVSFGSVTTGAGEDADKQQMSNTNAVTFNIANLTTNPTIVRGIAIVNSSNVVASYDTSFAANGSVIWYGQVASDISVSNGNVLTFAIGQITIRLG